MEHEQVLMKLLDEKIERTEAELKSLYETREALCGGTGLIAKMGGGEQKVKSKAKRKKKVKTKAGGTARRGRPPKSKK